MNYKNIIIAILICMVIATLFISVKKPKMHKVAFIYNSDYELVKNVEPEPEEKNIPTITQVEQIRTPQAKLKENVEKQILSAPTEKNVVQKENSAKKTQTVQKAKETNKPQAVKKEVKKEAPKVEQVKTVSNTPKKIEQKVEKPPVQKVEQKVEQKAVPQNKIAQKTEPTKTTVLTKEQEEIAWNVWRSNLQNQIMKDTALPTIPNGTIFRFSFDVDKFGKISNIQTYSDTKNYTPYAIQYIAPVIRSYQGKSILVFPKGTNRVTTTVKGAWKISNNTRYSTPKDYNDTEVVNR